MNNLAELHRSQGNTERAQTWYEEAIDMARSTQSPEGVFVRLCNLARLSVSCGHGDRACALLLESLQLASSAELKGMGEDVLEVAAGPATLRGDHDSAARFADAAATRMRVSRSQREPVDEAFIAPLLETAQRALGGTRYAAAQSEGASWGHDDAIARVRQWLVAATAVALA